MSNGSRYRNAGIFSSNKYYLVFLFIIVVMSNASLFSQNSLSVKGSPTLRFRLGVSVPSSVVRGFGAKHGVTIDLNYDGGRRFYDYMTKGPGFFSYIDFATRLYNFWGGPGEREFLKGLLDKADEEGGKVEISVKLYGLDLGWPGWEPYLYLFLESIGASRSSMRYIFLAGEWSYKNKVPPDWDDLYTDFQKAKQIVNSYGYELGWSGEGKYLTNIPKELYNDFYALGPRKRAQQVSRDPNCTKGAQLCYNGANWWERPNDVFLEAFTMWDREANIPNTPPYYICYDKFKEFIHGAVDRFDASGGAYPQAVCFEIMPETFNDVEGVECPYLDWWREFAEMYDLMIFDNAVKVRDSPGLQPPNPFPPYPCGLKYENDAENLPPFSVEHGAMFKGSVIARNEYTKTALRNTEIEIYLIRRTPRLEAPPWYPLPITKEEWSSMIFVGRVRTGTDGWAKGFTLQAPTEPGFYTVVARVPGSGQEMEAFSDVLEGIWVVEKVHRVEVRTNVKARLNFGPSAYGPPWQNCDPERWVEPNKPVVGNCAEGEWKFIVPPEVIDDRGEKWVFSHWEDGSKNPVHTILVNRDLVLEAYYSKPGAKSKINIYGSVGDDRGYHLEGASITVGSPVEQVSAMTGSDGRYYVTLSVNGAGDTIRVTASYHGRSGSASSTVPDGALSMQINVTIPRTAANISCSVSSSTVTIGGSITVSGVISPTVGGTIVTLTYKKPDASSFTHTVTTSPNGAYSDNYTPDQLGTYSVIASWPGNDDYREATSLPALFMVKKNPSSVSITLDSTSISPGDTLRISGTLSPPLSNVQVMLSYRVKGGSWVLLRNLTTNSNGRFSYVWANTPSEGEYELRASWLGDDYYEGCACTVLFVVMRVVNPPVSDFSDITEEPYSMTNPDLPEQNFTVALPAPNFTVSADPKTVRLPKVSGYNTTVMIKVSSLSNYTIELSLKVSGIPEGIEARLSQKTLMIQRLGANFTILVISTGESPPDQGNYSILIECNCGNVVASDLVNLIVVDRVPTLLKVNMTPTLIHYGDIVLINGSVSPPRQVNILVTMVLKNGTEIDTATFCTDETGKFSQSIGILLPPDEYVVRVSCKEDLFYFGSVLNLTLRIERTRIIITLSSNTTRTSSDEPVFLNGIVATTRGEPIRNMDLMILIAGETGTISVPVKTNENGIYTAVIPGLSPGKYDVVSLVEGNDYYEPARSVPVKIEVLHPVSRTLNDMLYPVVSIALTILALITSIRVIVSTVNEIRQERSYRANRLKDRK
ncbi:MAG: hypothetical protein FGF48_10500 [Candidatus Brockarchaeota archaeon]|nr:hypothetical protein [Candidatus Brockarchaeota archaeon]